jgi:hypothetical protein
MIGRIGPANDGMGTARFLLSGANYAKYSANNGVEGGDLQGNCHIEL